jgi:hypothetical protein
MKILVTQKKYWFLYDIILPISIAIFITAIFKFFLSYSQNIYEIIFKIFFAGISVFFCVYISSKNLKFRKNV